MTETRDEFMAGYLIAVANIIHLHDEPVIAEDVLREAQVNRNILKGMDFADYDLKPLRALFHEIERRDARRKSDRSPAGGNERRFGSVVRRERGPVRDLPIQR